MRWLPLLLLVPACFDQGAVCPTGTGAIGTFSLSYTQVDGGDTCVVTMLPDGGPANSPLLSTPPATALVFCAPDGGSGQTYLHFAGQGPRAVSMDGGDFSYSDSASGIVGSACACPLDIAETFSGHLTIADGGGATAFSGRYDEALSSGAGGCLCNVPCGGHYTVSGAFQQ
jgi:hypothetical protein